VAIQAFTCVAVPDAVLAIGARPVYVDTVRNGFTMDPVLLADCLSSDVRAVVVQHTFGLPADLPSILAAARPRGIPVVEDCAHTLSSSLDGRRVGEWGVGAFYSFEAGKPLFVGLGGAARMNDLGLRRVMEQTQAGFSEPPVLIQLQLLAMYAAGLLAYRPSTYWIVRACYRGAVRMGLIPGNYPRVNGALDAADEFQRRMGALQRRLLRRRIRELERQTLHRRWVAEEYRRRIPGTHVQHPIVQPGADPVYGRYPLLVENRSDLLARAQRAHVELAPLFSTPVHPLEGAALSLAQYEPGSCPNAESVARRVVSLPTGPTVTRRSIIRAAELFTDA
jgi:dTDP-4-amino-4,6-dideoxygalactose transaminase